MAKLADKDKVVEPVVSNKGVKLSEVLNYIWNYHAYVDTLIADSESLKARRADVQSEVEEARSKRLDIKEQVDKWLDESNTELKTTASFSESFRRPGSCSNFTNVCNCKRRCSVAKQADSHSKKIQMMMEGSSFEGGVSLKPKPLPLAPTLASGYKTIASRERCIERIKNEMITGDKLVIGLYGGKGVGKTQLIKKLAVEIESSGHFNGVIIATSAREETEASLSYMQDEIAERIGFNLKVKTLPERTRRLNDKLKSMGKIVIILDNFKKRLDLSKIGIPWPDSDNGSRILVVSRSLGVCEEMRTQMNIELKALSQEEALALFDEFAKEYSLTDDMNIQQARDTIFQKSEWMPGEIEMQFHSLHHKPPLPTEPIGATHVTGKKTYMLAAEALDITHIENPQYWRWSTPGLSTPSLKVAELILVWWLNIAGKVKEEWLSPATNYKAYFVYKLNPHAQGFKVKPLELVLSTISKTCYLDPSKAASTASEGTGVAPQTRADGWLEIEMGSFFNIGNSGAVIDLLVKDHEVTIVKTGLLVQGFEMRPLD